MIDLLRSFRGIMHKNWETLDVDKIQERWCCGDEPWLFRERWEKLFEDFCDVKQEKFDPSRVMHPVSASHACVGQLTFSLLLRSRNSMIPSNTAPFTTEPSSSRSSMRTAAKTSPKTDVFMNFTVVLKRCSISSLRRSMVSNQKRRKKSAY